MRLGAPPRLTGDPACFATEARHERDRQPVRKTAQSLGLQSDTGRGLTDIVSRYAQLFPLLQRYDEGLLAEPRPQASESMASTGHHQAT